MALTEVSSNSIIYFRYIRSQKREGRFDRILVQIRNLSSDIRLNSQFTKIQVRSVRKSDRGEGDRTIKVEGKRKKENNRNNKTSTFSINKKKCILF